MDAIYSRAIAAFERLLPGLLADPANRGKFILLHGDEVGGIYPTDDEALGAGYERYGLTTPFLIQEIAEPQPPVWFPRKVAPWPS